jgi:citrate synthase
MLRGEIPDKYEALIFDIALMLHAEHGGGNNSTFTVRAVSSSGANTYMAIAAGIASLSGHLHGGANESVKRMMKELVKEVKDWENKNEIEKYLKQILDKKKGDKSGKIYGLGHAVYTLSDPRAKILKKHARELSKQKGSYEKFRLYENVSEIASKLLSERHGKPISENVDFYSGLLYEQLGIPVQLYTPIFAMARVAGWAAHRLEQIVQAKILRPAYLAASQDKKKYSDVSERK